MKKLVKGDRMLCGVCSGIANYFECDPTIVRLIVAALGFCYGIVVIPYIVAAIIMPEG